MAEVPFKGSIAALPYGNRDGIPQTPEPFPGVLNVPTYLTLAKV